MNMDAPEWVAAEITRAIVKRKKEVFLGFPEKLFVHLNAIAPHLVDRALAASDAKARVLFNQPRAK
jgi:short-subunit dehydrogenase